MDRGSEFGVQGEEDGFHRTDTLIGTVQADKIRVAGHMDGSIGLDCHSRGPASKPAVHPGPTTWTGRGRLDSDLDVTVRSD
jgi:hypothetical protein